MKTIFVVLFGMIIFYSCKKSSPNVQQQINTFTVTDTFGVVTIYNNGLTNQAIGYAIGNANPYPFPFPKWFYNFNLNSTGSNNIGFWTPFKYLQTEDNYTFEGDKRYGFIYLHINGVSYNSNTIIFNSISATENTTTATNVLGTNTYSTGSFDIDFYPKKYINCGCFGSGYIIDTTINYTKKINIKGSYYNVPFNDNF